MNRTQKIIIVLGLTIFVIMGIYLPIECISIPKRTYESVRHVYFYKFLFEIPEDNEYWHYNINFSRLFLQWFVLGVLTLGMVWAFKSRSSNLNKAK